MYRKEIVDTAQITSVTDLFFTLVIDGSTDIGVERPHIVIERLIDIQHNVTVETAVCFANVIVTSIFAGKLLDSGCVPFVGRAHISFVIFQTSGDVDAVHDVPL